MKLRKFISLLLLAVYLFAVGGPSYASLSCRCIASKSYVTHSCCHHCEHSGLTSGKAIEAPCCDDRHSTEVELYTGSPSDNGERYTRCFVYALPPSLTAESLYLTDPLTTCETVARRRTPFLKEDYILCAGLRAPPVLA